MADWKDILSDNEAQLSEEELLKYLENDLPEEEKYSIEKKLNAGPFEADALQGLAQVQNKDNLKKHVSQLNKKLQQLTAKRQRKEKRKIRIFEWIILAILLLLFICTLGYIIISLYNKSNLHTHVISKAFSLFSVVLT